MTMPKDITKLQGADLLAALLSDVPVVVDNRRKAKPKGSQPAASGKKPNGLSTRDARTELERLSEAQRIRRIVQGMPDREWQPIAVVLMVQDTVCLKCGERTTAPFCEVPMLKLRRTRRRDDSKGTIYARLDHRIPAIHSKLPRYIQRQDRFTHTCMHCFEVTQKPKRKPYPY